MDLSSPVKRRLAAVIFGAAVPSVLVGSILAIGHAVSSRPQTTEDVGPGPTFVSTPDSSRSARVSLPPSVLGFGGTDSTSGYGGLPSNDLFGCQSVTVRPKKEGEKAAVVTPDTCRSRPNST
ncbi:MAG: hypothetical protein JWM93_3815 [Frankiales bacterium]|nr:hypothetical protein [Frankiales bacterium]